MVATRSITDTAAATTTETAGMIASRSLTETSTPSETETALGTYPATRTDSAATTDATIVTRDACDRCRDFGAVGYETGIGTYPASLSEAAGAVTDAMDAPGLFPGIRIDTVATADDQTLIAIFAPPLLESVATSDTFIGQVITYLTETSELTDDYSTATVYSEMMLETIVTSEKLGLGAFYDVDEFIETKDKYRAGKATKATYADVVAVLATASAIVVRKKDPRGKYFIGSSANTPIIGRSAPPLHFVGSSHLSIIGR